jgi:hypothetical protein
MTTTLSEAVAADERGPFTSPLDPGIAEYVTILRAAGVETFESCQGGPGHALPDPTVLFHGERSAGWHALAVAQEHDLPVMALRRAWQINDGEPSAPCWEMIFRSQGALV